MTGKIKNMFTVVSAQPRSCYSVATSATGSPLKHIYFAHYHVHMEEKRKVSEWKKQSELCSEVSSCPNRSKTSPDLPGGRELGREAEPCLLLPSRIVY